MKVLIMMFIALTFYGCSTQRYFATRTRYPETSITSTKYKSISVGNIDAYNSADINDLIIEYLKNNTKLKVLKSESVNEHIGNSIKGRSGYRQADLLIEGQYRERVEQAYVAVNRKAGIVHGTLSLRLIDNKTGEIIYSDNRNKSFATGNFDPVFQPNTISNQQTGVRWYLIKQFFNGIMPYRHYEFYTALIDSDYPGLKEAHELVKSKKFKKALTLFDKIYKRAQEQEIKGHALYGKSIAYGYSNQITLARKSYDKATEINPVNDYSEFGYILEDMEESYKRSKKLK